MRCEVCQLGPMDGISLYRQNKKGEKGIWRCEHHTEKDDPTLHLIVADIESQDPGRTKH